MPRATRAARPPVRIPVRLVPRAARDEIVGWTPAELKVRVAAVPQDGRANAALEAMLAHSLGLERRQVRVVAGRASRRKLVEVDGLDQGAVERRLPPKPAVPRRPA